MCLFIILAPVCVFWMLFSGPLFENVQYGWLFHLLTFICMIVNLFFILNSKQLLEKYTEYGYKIFESFYFSEVHQDNDPRWRKINNSTKLTFFSPIIISCCILLDYLLNRIVSSGLHTDIWTIILILYALVPWLIFASIIYTFSFRIFIFHSEIMKMSAPQLEKETLLVKSYANGFFQAIQTSVYVGFVLPLMLVIGNKLNVNFSDLMELFRPFNP